MRRKPHTAIAGGGVAGLYGALCAAAEADVLLDFPTEDTSFEAHVVLTRGREPRLERWS